MKKLFLASLLVLLLFSSSSAQEVCDGVDTITIKTGNEFGLCWKKNVEDLAGYKVYKSTVSNEQGDLFLEFLQGNCSADICETPRLTVAIKGIYFFKVYAYNDGRTVSYERYDPDTMEMKTVTYQMPPEMSEASNEVVLIVEDKSASKPSGCSIRLF